MSWGVVLVIGEYDKFDKEKKIELLTPKKLRRKMLHLRGIDIVFNYLFVFFLVENLGFDYCIVYFKAGIMDIGYHFTTAKAGIAHFV